MSAADSTEMRAGLPPALRALPHPVYLVTAAAAVVAANEAALQTLDGEAAAGTPAGRLPAAFGAGLHRDIREAAALATVVVHCAADPSGPLCLIQPLPLPAGEPPLLAVIALPGGGGRERALFESEQRYRKLVELLPDAIMVHAEGRVEYLNAAGARLWGGDSPQPFLGMPHLDLVHEEDREFVRARVHRIEQGDESPLREYRIRRLDGVAVPVEAAGTLISYGGRPANLVMYRDITARKEAEARLRDTLSRYRGLFENSPISLWEEDWSGLRRYLDGLAAAGVTDFAARLADPEELRRCFSLLRLKDANRASVRFYGARTRGELLTHLEKLFPEETETIRQTLAAVAGGQRYVVVEGVTYTLAGAERHVVYHFSVLPGSEHSWETVIVSVIDLTEQKLVERSLTELNIRLGKEEAERRQLSQTLMDMIEDDRRRLAMELHDHFGQVLTTLKLELEMLGAEVAAVNPRLGVRVERAAATATGTIADLKSLAAGLMPTMIEDLGLIPALQALVDGLRDSAGLDIHFFSNGITGRFDREKELALYRIAQESLNNVLKHARARRVDLNLLNKDGWASLSVEDDGVGFACDEDGRDAGPCGGMGLQIMRARAVKFGGELTIDTRPGEGVHILAEIPLV